MAEEHSMRIAVSRRGAALRRAAAIIAAALLLLFPLSAPPYLVLTVTAALTFGLFALSYDLVLGVTGIISVSHAVLFGAGAYGMAIGLTKLHLGFWPSVLAGAGIAAAAAWLVGFFSVRTSGAGFIIMTVIFAHAFETVANIWTPVTGGENGIELALSSITLLPGVGIRFAPGSHSLFYAVFLSLLIALAMSQRLVASPFGLVLRGINGNEARATALGYHVSRYKIAINILSGVFAAIAGMLYALSQGFVSVDLVRVLLSIEVIIWTILGGPGTLIGPAVAAVLMNLFVEYIRQLTQHYLILVGLVTLAVVILFPEGLGGIVTRLRRGGATGAL